MKAVCSIEIIRNNVTAAQFLAAIRGALARKGLGGYATIPSYGEFSCPVEQDCEVTHESAEESWVKYEKSFVKPYEWHTCVVGWDGSRYNEFCEFTFDDEQTGHGYYSLVVTEAD